MPEPGEPTPPIDANVERLARALGVPPERLQAALAKHGATARELLAAARAGVNDPLVQDVARALRIDASVAASALDALAPGPLGDRAASAMDGVASVIKGSAEEALTVGLEILGETIPRIVNTALAAVAVAGVAFVALGLLAIFQTTVFIQLLAILAGLALIGTGALLFALAWKVHEATATLRTLARVARRLRARQRERASVEADA